MPLRVKSKNKALSSNAIWVKKLFIIGIAVTSIFIGMGTFAVSIASADPPVSDPATLYCEKITPSKLHATCEDSNLMQEARNVASNYCTKVSDKDQASCIEKKAESFVSQAANSKPSSSSAFSSKLTGILKATGHSLTQPTKKSQNSLPPATVDGSGDCSTDESVNIANESCPDPAISSCTSNNCDIIGKYVNPGIRLFGATFGSVAVISLIAGGIQYTSSSGDPQKVSNAKKRIVNTMIAIVSFLFLLAFLNFLVPGGIF